MPAVGMSKKAPAQVSWSTCCRAKSAGEIDHDLELLPQATSTVTEVEHAARTLSLSMSSHSRIVNVR